MIITKKLKLDAAEVIVHMLVHWKIAKSVILFSSPTMRCKATRRKGSNEILITFGRPSYVERKMYKLRKKDHHWTSLIQNKNLWVIYNQTIKSKDVIR